MEVYIFGGKGGVGKTTSAVSVAVHKASLGQKTAIVDYDGGHSVKNTLGLADDFPANTVHKVSANLHVAIIEFVNYLGIEQSKAQGQTLDEYLEQFPADLGFLPLIDMVNAFFGIPTDIPTFQKFVILVGVLHKLQKSGFENVVIDVEPTAGFERLLSNARSTIRSIRNLRDQGRLSLAILGAKWPDIAGFLKKEYIVNADTYCHRIQTTVGWITGAVYFIVCTPEAGPISQTFEVRKIIEKYGGVVKGYVVNNIRGDGHEESNIAKLTKNTQSHIIRIKRKPDLHASDLTNQYRSIILSEIGASIDRAVN